MVATILSIGVPVVMIALVFLVFVEVRHRRRRQSVEVRAPKGTRPQVRMDCDGVLYDLTDTLEQLSDENGNAVWQIHGPLHLRFESTPVLQISTPVPQHTEVRLNLVGEPLRFASPEEIEIELRRREL